MTTSSRPTVVSTEELVARVALAERETLFRREQLRLATREVERTSRAVERFGARDAQDEEHPASGAATAPAPASALSDRALDILTGGTTSRTTNPKSTA
ncbi:hypothetical protein ACH4SP_10630 [Streptomyces sp. NPDC021093]|uniref:hypothetical protein n=1 Tax=Streptomyces sp. NPDC021093 TaxID=3365112 RepID=UPI0037972592